MQLKFSFLAFFITLLDLRGAQSKNVNFDPPFGKKLGPAYETIQSAKKATPFSKLIEDPTCKDDIEKLCGKELGTKARTNFAVLECLQNQKRDLGSLISEECHHTLWSFKNSLSKIGIDEKYTQAVCGDDLEKLAADCPTTDTPYEHLSCLTKNLGKVKDDQCRQYVTRFAVVVFSDYALISQMTEDCEDDINKRGCGRVQSSGNKQLHSQGLTIECLSKYTTSLEFKCKKQILRLAEIQSEDFHLDRAFYFACRDDRNKFCGKIHAGNGRVYKCLMKHKNDRTMSPQCAEQLSRRQSLIAEDYKASKGLTKACKSDIFANKCRKGVGEDSHDIKLSKILICLENALHNDIKVDRRCQDEMLLHRQMVMANYKMSPDLVASCAKEITNLCDGSLQPATMHCLMMHAKKRGSKVVSPDCKDALSHLIKEVDPGEDWRVDPVLYDACLPVKESRCDNVKGGEGRVMRCLMRQLNTHFMTPHCEMALLEIQYFISRDWRLDSQLYTACHKDAATFCNAQPDWINPSGSNVDSAILVLPCLFRIVYHSDPKHKQLDNECSMAVHRVMHERAAFVELHPIIEKECMQSLSYDCSENTGPGEEIACLQRNYERLPTRCQAVVKNYTEAESKDIGLNTLIMMHCGDVLDEVCTHIMQDGLETIMECLIKNKNKGVFQGQQKCKAIVEDFQIAMMEEVVFPPKFREECYTDVRKHCLKSQNRKEVVDCLSQQHLSDALNEDRPSITKGCRVQLRKLISQRHENIKLDPIFKKTCEADIGKHCKKEYGSGKIMECLRKHQESLEDSCHKLLFSREQEESLDPNTDTVLMFNCQEMAKIYCHDVREEEMFHCLVRKKDETDFDDKCRSVVVSRMIEHSKDVRLLPGLFKACKKEREEHCSDQENAATSFFERNGIVLECLKKLLPQKRLLPPCQQKMIQFTRNAVLNYKMNSVLMSKCNNDIKVLCPEMVTSEDGGMEECLKTSLEKNLIMEEECIKYVAESVQIEHADIHLDPVLNRDCNLDLQKYCNDGEQGTHLRCLFDHFERNPAALNVKCREALRNRKNMYKTAFKIFKFDSIGELVFAVNKSVERPVMLTVLFFFLVSIFIIGLSIFRLSKRTYVYLKKRR